MGLDVYGYVMAAVPYNTVVTTREEVTEVTRYNEETGEPYIKTLRETKTFVGTQKVDGGKSSVKKVLDDLGLLCYARDSNSRDYRHIGIKVATVDYMASTYSLETDSASLKCKELIEKLLSIGITDAQPQIVFGLYQQIFSDR